MSTSRRSTPASPRRPWPVVDDVEGIVDELASKGVAFERYEEGPIVTDEKGIATFEGGAKVAYFRDPDGNTLSIAQAPRP
jgi:catechol 2,3-dioxygenase-like lactoylglutathione lyase family enzyme